MAKVLEMPKLSPTMEEGQISAWHKNEGDSIAVDDLLAEVETDKATMEYRSFDKGTLLKILAPAGTVVKLGQPVAVIGNPGEDVSGVGGEAEGLPAGATMPPKTTPAAEAPAASAPATAQTPTGATPPAAPKPVPEPAPAPRPAPSASATASPPAQASALAGEGDRVRASPYVRKLARERELDLHGVAGSGPNGRIVARDLEHLGANGAADRAAPPSERRPLSQMRKAIARRLTESKQTVPHFYLTIDVDADALASLREQINRDLEARGEKISLNDLLIKACALALVRVPECNASFTADAIVVHRRVDISVAVAVPDGLLTPVVRDADDKPLLAIAAEVKDLAARAKAKKLKPEEMQDGTFSISNLGMFGIDEFAAVINPPEGAILAVGQVRREPVVRGDAVVPGRRLGLTLSCDHRVVDGAVGATFLKALREILERPTQILVG